MPISAARSASPAANASSCSYMHRSLPGPGAPVELRARRIGSRVALTDSCRPPSRAPINTPSSSPSRSRPTSTPRRWTRPTGPSRNQVKIPGFRKGKVPKQIIDAQIGRDVVRDEFLQAAVPDYYRQAVCEHDLAPITDPDIDLDEFADDAPLKFTAVVEVRPRLELHRGGLQRPEDRAPVDRGRRVRDRRVGRPAPRAVRRARAGRAPRPGRRLRHDRPEGHRTAGPGDRGAQPHRLPVLRGLRRVRSRAGRGAARHEGRRDPQGHRGDGGGRRRGLSRVRRPT